MRFDNTVSLVYTVFDKLLCGVLLRAALAESSADRYRIENGRAKAAMNYSVEESLAAWNANAEFWDGCMGDESNDFHRETVRPKVTELLNPERGDFILDKTTPRLIQFHTLKNAVNPPFLGGFSIFNTVVA